MSQKIKYRTACAIHFDRREESQEDSYGVDVLIFTSHVLGDRAMLDYNYVNSCAGGIQGVAHLPKLASPENVSNVTDCPPHSLVAASDAVAVLRGANETRGWKA